MEHAPRNETQAERPQDLRERLIEECGPVPESLEQSVDWAGNEMHELRARSSKAGRRIRMFALATGVALATMGGMAPKAEAGEGWRRAGAVIGVLGRMGQRASEFEAMRREGNIQQLERQMGMLEYQARQLAREFELTQRKLQMLNERLERETDEERIAKIKDVMKNLEQSLGELQQKAAEISEKEDKLHERLVKEGKAAERAGIFGVISDIAAETGDRVRWRY